MLLPTQEIKVTLAKVDLLVTEATLLVRDIREIVQAVRLALGKK